MIAVFCKLMLRTIVRTEKCHLIAVTLAEVDTQAADVVISQRCRRCRHIFEKLYAVFVPCHRIQLLTAQIVFASERHCLPPWINDAGHLQSLYLQSGAYMTKNMNNFLIPKKCVINFKTFLIYMLIYNSVTILIVKLADGYKN